GDSERLGAFLAASGAEVDDLTRAAQDPEFLGFVLDCLLADEAALIEACAALGLAPEMPMRARAGLPGGALPHWT
ncbi:MAG: DUF3572 family protein, partial [Pseudomonadota bacterium]